MAEVIPFKGILYNPQKVDAASVMAPPYDIVTPEFKKVLYKKSRHNIIRIDFGKDSPGDNMHENRYTRAAQSLTEWLKNRIFIQDRESSFYCYEINYNPPLPAFNSPLTKGGHRGVKGEQRGISGHKKTLRGFIGAVRIEELGTGHIHPHEMTYSKPKSDRLNILRFCQANTSPIFSLYSSPERRCSSILEKAAQKKAFIEAGNGDGFIHRLWQIKNKTSIRTIAKELSGKEILIADGHHRYGTALEYRNEMNRKGLLKTGKEPFNYVMMFLVNMEEDGLTILPTHRLAHIKRKKDIHKSLSPYFDISAIPFNRTSEDQAKKAMFKTMQKGRNVLGMLIKGQKAFHVLRFKGPYSEIETHRSLRNIDVTILHKLIFEKLLGVDAFEYEMDADIVINKLNSGSLQAAFFLNPTKVHDVKEVALSGQRMPPKSTYFYPKLLTGMVIYKF